MHSKPFTPRERAYLIAYLTSFRRNQPDVMQEIYERRHGSAPVQMSRRR